MNRIQELEKLILENTSNYYEGRHCVSDAQFDTWIDELTKIDPDNKILHSVGWGYDLSKSAGKKFKHLNYLGGIGNKPRVAKDTRLPAGCIKTPKMDGGSVELQYYKGVLQRSLTRGDGTTGLDCTEKLKHIVPSKLDIPYTGNIVGEYVISSQDLEGFSDSISQRNIPNGFLGRDSATEEDCKRFSFVAYKIGMSKSHTFINRVEILNFIKNLGFLTVAYVEESIPYQEALDKLKIIGNKTYLLDGIVASSPSISQSADGSITYPNEIAYKTISETATPLIESIDWNLTRTGKIIPTVVTESITLSGANINRFLAHNAWNVKNQGIGVGARLEVTRSGEVIPYILDVIEPVEPTLPTYCPACQHKLKWSGVNLVCDNPDCSGQNYSKISNWIEVLASVDNLGGSLIGLMIEALDINTIPDLYKEHDISILTNYEGIGQSKLQVIHAMFEKLNSSHDLVSYLMAMNLSGLGYQSSKKICEGTDIYNEIKEEYYSDEFEKQLIELKGVNYPTKITLLKNWGRLIDLLKFVKIAPSTSPESNEISIPDNRIRVCITGRLESLTKSAFYSKYSDKIVESDIKSCDYLIANKDSGSSKYKQATKLGKVILTESEFLERCV